ncbi:MAG: transposase [Treponema sp.]|jgi:hypothetical protein|nr:transposase [Treponema sp.]
MFWRTCWGEALSGILSRDLWGAYQRFSKDVATVMLQLCWAYMIRDVLFLAKYPDESVVKYGNRLMNKIYAMFTTIHQKEALPCETWIEQMNRHKKGILKTSQWDVPENKDARNMAKRLKEHGAQYFVFITEDIPPTNNPGEQVIRMLVIDRKVTQGTRSG